MRNNMDFSVASSQQIEEALGKQLRNIRLSRNITQSKLAKEAGVSTPTIGRLERGKGISLDTFIRVLIALGIQHNLSALLPDPNIRPMERISTIGVERQRARPESSGKMASPWEWGDSEVEDE
jgi:transcriptional regulator with XRE-family HTH domain